MRNGGTFCYKRREKERERPVNWRRWLRRESRRIEEREDNKACTLRRRRVSFQRNDDINK